MKDKIYSSLSKRLESLRNYGEQLNSARVSESISKGQIGRSAMELTEKARAYCRQLGISPERHVPSGTEYGLQEALAHGESENRLYKNLLVDINYNAAADDGKIEPPHKTYNKIAGFFKNHPYFAIGAGLLVISAGLGCVSSPSEQPQNESASNATSTQEATIILTGSTTVLPAGEALSEAYNHLHPEVKVHVTGGGSGHGITAVTEGQADIGMSSRELKKEEKDKYGDLLKETKIGYDGIGIIVSRPIYDSNITDLTIQELKEIYGGNTSNWKTLGGPDKEIFSIGRTVGSGTRDTFNEKIMGSASAETHETITEGENAGVLAAVKGSETAIGYVGWEFAQGNDIGVLKLNGITPTIEGIKDGSYPLSRALYFDVYGNPTQETLDFINYTTSTEGQEVIKATGFIPL